jgi:hypothetical protein
MQHPLRGWSGETRRELQKADCKKKLWFFFFQQGEVILERTYHVIENKCCLALLHCKP